MKSTRRRYIQRSLYRMKREYGVSIDFYSVDSSKDAITGFVTNSYSKFTVTRAISIPGIALTKFYYDAGYTNATHNTTQAGEFDIENHAFLIAKEDMSFEPKSDMYIVSENQKHQISEIQLLDHVYIIRTVALQNQVFNQIHDARVHHFIGVNDDSESP